MKPAHVLDDVLDVCRGNRLDLRHVAEFPMMSFDAEFRGPEKGRIAMVIRFINLVDERRTLLCAGGLWSVARRAMRVEFRLSCLQFRRNRAPARRRLRR